MRFVGAPVARIAVAGLVVVALDDAVAGSGVGVAGFGVRVCALGGASLWLAARSSSGASDVASAPG